MNLIESCMAAAKAKPAATGAANADLAALEQDLSDALGLKVTLTYRGGKGDLTIRYDALEQLDDLFRRLMRP